MFYAFLFGLFSFFSCFGFVSGCKAKGFGVLGAFGGWGVPLFFFVLSFFFFSCCFFFSPVCVLRPRFLVAVGRDVKSIIQRLSDEKVRMYQDVPLLSGDVASVVAE